MALVRVEGYRTDIWTRCGKRGVESHHRLTRARGGTILDKAGETYHLIDLCPKHHRMADGEMAYRNGLLIDGYVTTGPDGTPVYSGSDPYLKAKYGSVGVRDLWEEEGSASTGT